MSTNGHADDDADTVNYEDMVSIGLFYTSSLYREDQVNERDESILTAMNGAFMAQLGDELRKVLPDVFAQAEYNTPFGNAVQAIGDAALRLAVCSYLAGRCRNSGIDGNNTLDLLVRAGEILVSE